MSSTIDWEQFRANLGDVKTDKIELYRKKFQKRYEEATDMIQRYCTLKDDADLMQSASPCEADVHFLKLAREAKKTLNILDDVLAQRSSEVS